ncbi:IS110 family transposase [Phyllobacterium endophyticum]|nr:transposase [Phyllobacterium endophyticum]TXR50544.1 IS110 family transposase [Phyllobacterium endophyticum]
MGYLGLVPGKPSAGETVKRNEITKARNGRVKALLVECAWTYRIPPE